MSGYFVMKLLSLTLITASVVAAQSAPPRKDIPAIAKSANGAIVTIVMAVNDKPIAQGSGFLVSPDGVVVTNYHVIEAGNVAIVKFPDGTVFPVDGVLAADKVRDLAIIKIHGKTFRTLTLGNSDQIQVGEEVVAIGNPLSLESTVSNGIISAIRTSKEQGGKFLQTTAPISPGSSGGPLFNMAGEVVGINTMYLEGGENLNFAIPVNDAKLLLSTQSTKLQDLPNEAPKESSEPSEAPRMATFDQKLACSKLVQAKVPPLPDTRVLSQFSVKAQTCFAIEMTSPPDFTGTPIGEKSEKRYSMRIVSVIDVVSEGKVAEFTSGWEITPQSVFESHLGAGHIIDANGKFITLSGKTVLDFYNAIREKLGIILFE